MIRAVALFVLSTAAAGAYADEATVSVSLAIPSRDDARRISVGGADAHFHVLLSSQSSAPQRIWDETFSWGYYALSFELVGEDGTVREVRKKKVGFTRNVPASWILEPHGHFVLDVYLGDRRTWEGVPRPRRDCEIVQMRAVFEVTQDEASRKQSAWTGRVVSSTHGVTVCE